MDILRAAVNRLTTFFVEQVILFLYLKLVRIALALVPEEIADECIVFEAKNIRVSADLHFSLVMRGAFLITGLHNHRLIEVHSEDAYMPGWNGLL